MTVQEDRENILKLAFNSFLQWEPPEIFETVGPFDPSVFSSFDARRRLAIEECRNKLAQYSDEEIAILTDRELDDPADIRTDWRSLLEPRIKSLNPLPPWFAGGFGHPDYVADFEHWAKMPSFSVHELLCLSVGLEPNSFDPQFLTKASKEDMSQYWAPLKFLLRRREQLQRQFDPHLDGRKVVAKMYSDWANRVDFQTHPEFIRLLRLYHGSGVASGSQDSPLSRPDKREIDKIAQLFTAMAIEYYGYDPTQSKSPVTKEITDLAATMGMTISDDTVRKYLKLGARFIPNDWTPG